MVLTEQEVSYERTVNLKDYNSLRLGASVKYVLEPTEDPEEAAAKAFELCRNRCRAEALDFQKRTGKEIK